MKGRIRLTDRVGAWVAVALIVSGFIVFIGVITKVSAPMGWQYPFADCARVMLIGLAMVVLGWMMVCEISRIVESQGHHLNGVVDKYR
ncbi:MAG: hypothetical protein AAB581_02005 [Patescibacteria group bacterium]